MRDKSSPLTQSSAVRESVPVESGTVLSMLAIDGKRADPARNAASPPPAPPPSGEFADLECSSMRWRFDLTSEGSTSPLPRWRSAGSGKEILGLK